MSGKKSKGYRRAVRALVSANMLRLLGSLDRGKGHVVRRRHQVKALAGALGQQVVTRARRPEHRAGLQGERRLFIEQDEDVRFETTDASNKATP